MPPSASLLQNGFVRAGGEGGTNHPCDTVHILLSSRFERLCGCVAFEDAHSGLLRHHSVFGCLSPSEELRTAQSERKRTSVPSFPASIVPVPLTMTCLPSFLSALAMRDGATLPVTVTRWSLSEIS